MQLSSGARLGPYEIAEPVGAGGMGEVYRARDTRLERNVAIKVLPADFSDNAQLRLRFEREAKTISALNHPNICTLFDIGRESETDYLVMEYLEGETLADRLGRGALPLAQALQIAIDITRALDRAHRQGIVHRDLKPGNVMLTKSGVKLLDFGLAKVSAPAVLLGGDTDMTVQRSPRDGVSKPLTTEGMIVGTFQYMAPEQLEGREADARSDIFAFGALLYEMITGRRAFDGKTRTSLIAAIISAQPAPVSTVQPLTPPALDHVIRKCLEKEPDDRWQSAHDILSELQWINDAGSQAGVATTVTVRRKTRERLAWSLAAVLALAAAAATWGFIARAPKAQPVVRFVIPPPPGTALIPYDLLGLSLSPNGQRLAFVAIEGDGRQRIWIRDLSSMTPTVVPETDGASYPFWSPDGRYLAYFAGGNLKKVDLRGGSPQILAPAPSGRGGAWSDRGILFAPNIESAIWRVSANGGKAEAVTQYDAKSHSTHRFPSFLPDGDHFLYVVRARVSSGREFGRLCLGSVSSHETKQLLDEVTNGFYVSPGYVLYGKGTDLLAQPFDARKLAFTDDAIPVLDEKVTTWEPKNLLIFTVSNDGTIVYLPDTNSNAQMEWVDRTGQVGGKIGEPGLVRNISVSPDGTKVLYVVTSAQNQDDVWIHDLSRGHSSRVTFQSRRYSTLTWAPDSTRFAVGCVLKSSSDICVKSLVEGGDIALLYDTPNFKTLGSWFGNFLYFDEQDPLTNEDLIRLEVGTRKVTRLLATPFREDDPEVSPDGKWLAYVSNETGRPEIYVRPASGAPEQWQISTGGALRARWRGDGKELFFASADGKLMSVPIENGATFQPGVAKALFDLPDRPELLEPIFEDVTRDGQRFFLTVPSERRADVPFHAVLNWPRVLEKANAN